MKSCAIRSGHLIWGTKTSWGSDFADWLGRAESQEFFAFWSTFTRDLTSVSSFSDDFVSGSITFGAISVDFILKLLFMKLRRIHRQACVTSRNENQFSWLETEFRPLAEIKRSQMAIFEIFKNFWFERTGNNKLGLQKRQTVNFRYCN